MDRRRSMIVWLLVFGLIGVLSEWIGGSHALRQAVDKSVRMKKDVGSKKLENIQDTKARKNIPDEERLQLEEGRRNDRERQGQQRGQGGHNDQRVAQMEAALRAAERQRFAEIREMRQRQQAQRGRGRDPPSRLLEAVLSCVKNGRIHFF